MVGIITQDPTFKTLPWRQLSRVAAHDLACRQSGGWGWGCSHSYYQRIVWDPTASAFASVCVSDTYPQPGLNFDASSLLRDVDLSYANVGNIVLSPSGGYWLATSDIRAGQPAGANGLADVHLIHFGAVGKKGTSDQDITLASDPGLNDRATHLSGYGSSHLLAAWETSPSTGDLAVGDTARKLQIEALDATSGAALGAPMIVGVKGNRYNDFKAFPDGSVAYVAAGSTTTKLDVLRVLPCN